MKIFHEIEFRSDTCTLPTMEMRKAMFNSIVGDDGYGLDPTVKELQELGASLMGKEEGLFFPSGVMGNLASVMSHCWNRGSEIILGDMSHINFYEQGGISTVGAIHSRTVANTPDGCFEIPDLESKFRPVNEVHSPNTSLVCIENTHNKCGGAVLPMDFVQKVRDVSKSHGVATHIDGARIFNASVALGVPVADIVQGYDSVSFCLSKGLSCPIGTLVVGSSEFMERLKRCRKVLGGQMRQVGVVASCGIIALNSMVQRLADDHQHARMIAQAISSLGSQVVSVNLKRVHTNIVFLDLDAEYATVQQFCRRFREVTEEEKEELGDECCTMNFNPFGPNVCRIVTHSGVTYDDTLLAVKKLKYVIGQLEKHPMNRNKASNGSHSINGSYGITNGSNGSTNGTNGHTKDLDLGSGGYL